MFSKTPPPKPSRVRLQVGVLLHCFHDKLATAARILSDPKLPFIVLGVVAVGFFATLILRASGELVFGLLLVGFITAFLETKFGNDDRDR